MWRWESDTGWKARVTFTHPRFALGGIHFMSANTQGLASGARLGQFRDGEFPQEACCVTPGPGEQRQMKLEVRSMCDNDNRVQAA